MVLMKKSPLLLIVLASLALLASSLQLSRDEQTHYVNNNHENTHFYGKYSRSHRTQQYIAKVKESNLDFINQFNNKNKRALKSSKGLLGSSNSEASAFSVASNKYVQFTQEQFDHLFKGYKPKAHHHEHEQAQTTVQHQKTYEPTIARLLLQAHASDEIKAHFSQVQLHNTESQGSESTYQHDGMVASLLGYQNPYQIDNHEINSMYGSTNSPNNYGWDWQKLSSSYYMDDSPDFFKGWEKSHWGFDVNPSSGSGDWWDSVWDSGASSSSSSKSPSWWNSWSSTQQKNKNNNDWWSDISGWWDTPSKPIQPNKPNGPVSPINPNKPNGPVSPIKPSNNSSPSNMPTSSKRLDPYPSNAVQVNWAQRGGTTHIKNQGECGSCWSFAALGTMQSFLVIQGRGIMDLSEQMLVDCSKASAGCEGGNVDPSFDYIIKNGIVTEDKYPYRGLDQKCFHTSGPTKIAKYVRTKGRASIQQYLRQGPVAGAIGASGQKFQFYSKGIFDGCTTTKLDHAIVIVGFTKDYWIIRNSWGTDWGEQGHMRLKKAQNNNNACGIQSEAIAITA